MATIDYQSVTSGSATPGAAAYALSRLGMRVFPLGAAGTPAFSGWQQKASAAVDQIRSWWTGEFASCGVGVACGAESEVWVLDVDVKTVDGFASLRSLELADGHAGSGLYRTMCVRTPSGGAHLYYRWDERASAFGGVRNSTSDLAPGVDVRGEGGYVRGPGTPGYAVVPRETIVDTHRATAPLWLTDLTKRRPESDPVVIRERTEARAARSGDARAWGASRLERAGKRLRGAAPGTRNAALNRAAYALGIASASGGFDEADAWDICRSAMADAGARDTIDQQRRTFRSGWRAGRAASGSG